MSKPETVDYVVIGSGSAGAVIAARLAEDPNCSILVLEAGGMDDKFFYQRPGALGLVYQVPQLKAAADWGYYTVPQAHLDQRKMPYTRGRIVGGCSTVNGMLYVRGHRDNYDRWVELGCPGWGYDSLLPLFKRSENHPDGPSAYHGANGPLQVTRQEGCSPVSEAWNAAASAVCGVPVLDDFNGERQEGVGLYHQTAAKRRRSSASVAFLHPAREKNQKLRLQTGALVTRLVVEGGKVCGVCYEAEGASHEVRANAEVILSAGAIGSPQILMLSGIGPADHLRSLGIPVVHDLPGVGANLHDHLYAPIRFHGTKDTGHTSTAPHFLWGMFRDFAFNQGWFGKTFLEAGGFVKTSPSQPRPDLQFLTIPWAYPEPNDDTLEGQSIAKTPSFTVLAILLYPKSRGNLRLASKDPKAAPLIDPNYLHDDADMQVLLHGLRLARTIAKTAPLSAFMKGEAFPGPATESDEALRAHVRLASKTVYHPVGTCKMGQDSLSVVDPSLRLQGLPGLRVADASIMPEIVGGNTNAPTIAIGERCADLLRGRA